MWKNYETGEEVGKRINGLNKTESVKYYRKYGQVKAEKHPTQNCHVYWEEPGEVWLKHFVSGDTKSVVMQNGQEYQIVRDGNMTYCGDLFTADPAWCTKEYMAKPTPIRMFAFITGKYYRWTGDNKFLGERDAFLADGKPHLAKLGRGCTVVWEEMTPMEGRTSDIIYPNEYVGFSFEEVAE